MISWVAITGEDPQLIAQAKKLADRWLTDNKAIDPDVLGTVFKVAARHGDRAFFDRVRAAAVAEKETRDRMQLIFALASFRDPAIVKEAFATMPEAVHNSFAASVERHTEQAKRFWGGIAKPVGRTAGPEA
jgi:hypothetical protein